MKDKEVFDLLQAVDDGYALTREELEELWNKDNVVWNNIDKIPESIDLLSNLKQLTVLGATGFAQINVLPESIGNLTKLEMLDLRFSQICELPESIGNLTNLEMLDLSFSQICELPESIGYLTLLQVLDLASTKVRVLPESIGHLTQLQILNLSSTQICELPECIENLANLQSINLGSTQITYLPESLGNLTNLQRLNMSGTRISELPESLVHLMSLQSLDLSYSDIVCLPNLRRFGGMRDLRLQGCTYLSGELHLPEELTEIGDKAFSDCSNLSGELRLPESLTSIGDGAFSGCSGFIGELRLPENLTSVGDSAFSGCSGFFGELRLPENLTSIGDSAFSGCSGFSGELRLPENLTSIGDSAFSGCSGFSGELYLPEGMKSIGNRAFSGNSGLSGALHLPVGLKSIGDEAFFDCNGLSGELHLPEGLTRIGIRAFSHCSGLSGDIYLPEELTSIDARAFYGNSGLCGELHLPGKLISIGDEAFYGCNGLSGEIIFPESLNSIGSRVFCGCSGLTGELHLPENLTSIGDEAFYGCSGLTGELHLPESLNSIGDRAFYGCSGLSVKSYQLLNTINFGDESLRFRSGLSEELYLPEELISISDNQFSGQSSLRGEIHFPNNIKNIGEYAFFGCSGLSGELRLPEGLISIGKAAFAGCSGLTGEISLPKGIQIIGEKAFYGCSGLQLNVSLPETIKSIGVGAFIGIKHSDISLKYPKRLFDDYPVSQYDNSELENAQHKIVGKYYIRLEEVYLKWKRRAGRRKSNEAYFPIPSMYAYDFGILKGTLYYSRLYDRSSYVVLKATGSQSRREYAKQFEGNDDLTVLYDWYKSLNAVVGDYIIATIYDDREVAFDYIRQKETHLIDKYSLVGNKGRVIEKSDLDENENGFRLVSLLVKSDENTIMDYSFFPDNINESGEEPVTTIIVGENGSGKSHTLKILTEIFLAVQNENTRNSLTYTYYRLDYILHGKRINIEIAKNKVGIHVGKQLFDDIDVRSVLPTKVLALAFMLNDKYIYRSASGKKEVYEYLGVRGSSNAAWTSTFGNRVAENIFTLIADGALWGIIRHLSEFLSIDPRMSISVEINEDDFLGNSSDYKEELRVATIQDYLTKIVKKDKILKERSSYTALLREKAEEQTYKFARVIYDLLCNKKVMTRGKTAICEIVFKEEGASKEKEDYYYILHDLYVLQIITNATLFVYKDGERCAFDDVSSGEKNILYAVLNVAGHIKKNSLVMIDEPEISLHPNWQMLYVSLLKTIFKDYKTCHILIATHSPYMVSDLNPQSSSLIVLSNEHGERSMRTIDYSTYAWSVENILYNIFHVRSIRNYYFEMDLRELIQLIGEGNKNLDRVSELYVKLSSYVFDEKDPLKLILQQAKEYLRDAEA